MIDFNRRELLESARTAGLASLVPMPARFNAANSTVPDEPFGYCLNTSTISGQKPTIVESIRIASRAGYQAIEPWIRELDEYVKSGGRLSDLRKQLEDANLKVASAIGFFDWVVDDADQRRKGLDEARRNMEMVREIGGGLIAAPPAGATDRSNIDLRRIAERYQALLVIGDEVGVVPQVEVWGFSKTLGKLSEAAFVAIEAAHPRACVLADVYHLYKGGSGFDGLHLLGRNAMHAIHVNDYPASPPRAEIKDEHRVFPGDGVAPLGKIFRDLRDSGFRGVLSLELFNREYWKDDAFETAKRGLEKTRAAVRAALNA